MPDVKPILFSGPMVRAILEGRKTQTRRVLRAKPHWDKIPSTATWRTASGYRTTKTNPPWMEAVVPAMSGTAVQILASTRVPARVGDILWVRESGVLLREAYDSDPVAGDLWQDAGFLHSADGTIVEARNHGTPLADWSGECARVNRPSIHMPRWASRLTLEVTEVRVQRLQEISEEDALAEGIDMESDFAGLCKNIADASYPNSLPKGSPVLAVFEKLWNDINAKRGFGWDVNPWVVAVTFEATAQNVDDFLKARDI